MMMESLSSSSATTTTLPSFSIFPSSSTRTSSSSSLSSKKTFHFRLPSSKRDDGNNDSESQSKSSNQINFNLSPVLTNRCFSISPLSNDAAMGLVLSAATGRGWTTGSGMEGPPVPAVGKDGQSGTENISTFPWSLFTKSPRRRMLIAFTCTICGQRTTRAINPHAYTDGTVFVQCCECNAYHKLVDHLNLFQETNCYLNSSFKYKGPGWDDLKLRFMDMDSDDDDVFPVT
uniref:DNL-type domain-containing protein n=1 Tax=Medicago truncatula TaxID=3880 RepID=I3T8B1_MEDTR|nr:unknown [Medicago truncatula]